MGGSGVVKLQTGLFEIRLQGVNAFLLDAGRDGLVLVDAGVAGSVARICEAVHRVGRDIKRLRHVLVTHCHPDHAGGLAELKALTGARIYMHRRDAILVAAGRGMRPLRPTPGAVNALLYRVMIAPKPKSVPSVKVDAFLRDGDRIPLDGGILVHHTPGHTEGHLVFRAPERGVLFVGDAAANFLGVRPMVAYEHHRQGLMSLRQLCRLDFGIACFGHGPTILEDAAGKFRERFVGKRDRRGGWGEGGRGRLPVSGTARRRGRGGVI